MKRIYRILPLLLSLLSAGCSNDALPRYSVLQGLRVMELNLDQPEINFDGTQFSPSSVNLTPWVSDLYGGGRALTMNAYACLDPGVGSGVNPSCSANLIGKTSLTQVLEAQTVSGTSSFLSPNYTGSLDPIAIPLTNLGSILQTALGQNAFTLSSSQNYNGYSILVFFEIYPTGKISDKVTAMKRLVFSGSAKTPKNKNPATAIVRNNSTEISSFPTVDSQLEAYTPSTEAETYLQMDNLGALTSATETLLFTWFMTGSPDIPCSNKKECNPDGYLALAFTSPGQTNPFYAPQVAKPTNRGRVIVVVAKDNRGGNGVKKYCDGGLCP